MCVRGSEKGELSCLFRANGVWELSQTPSVWRGGGVTRVNVPVCTCVRQESNREHSVSLCSSFHWHKRNVCGLGVVCSCVCGRGEVGGGLPH